MSDYEKIIMETITRRDAVDVEDREGAEKVALYNWAIELLAKYAPVQPF